MSLRDLSLLQHWVIGTHQPLLPGFYRHFFNQLSNLPSPQRQVPFFKNIFRLIFIILCACLVPVEVSLEPLELKLQTVVNHRMGAGNQTRVHCKSSKCSQPPANAPFSPRPPGRSQSSILTFPETHMLSLEMRRISLNSSI